MKAINLLNDRELYFDKKTSATYAVVYGFCDENNMLSKLFNHCNNNTLLEFYKTLPLFEGKKTISCGDWAARIY